MQIKNVIVFLLWIIVFQNICLSQNDTSYVNQNKLIQKASFFGFQLEATSILVSSELGALIDYDLYVSPNNKYSVGLRFSTEYYDYISLDVGGNTAPGPFWDLNIYGRHSIRGKYFWFSPILGLSFHNSMEKGSSGNTFLVKWGFEVKYNLYGENVGLVFKYAGSFNREAGYLGIGISYGFYDK
ncbi:MAG: hypothetical protein WCS69_10485 [Ignavibacteriaceae bacterium]|jgi:hypothetical protein